MAIYRSIQTSFWTDARIVDDFTPEDKLFYLYLMTNPHTNLSGCYEISVSQVVMEVGISKQKVHELIKRMDEEFGVIKYSESTKEILLINWHKYNWTNSSKYRKALLAEIEKIKNKEFHDYLKGLFDGIDTVSIGYQYGIDTVSEESGYPMHTPITNTLSITDTDTITNSDSDNGNSKKIKQFIPPTLEEVEAYCKERGNNINPQSFVDFYSSKGWMVGKNKMKDWKACVRTWEQRSRDNTQPRQSTYMQAIQGRIDAVDNWLEKSEEGAV